VEPNDFGLNEEREGGLIFGASNLRVTGRRRRRRRGNRSRGRNRRA
jgi:hypothetical protein